MSPFRSLTTLECGTKRYWCIRRAMVDATYSRPHGDEYWEDVTSESGARPSHAMQGDRDVEPPQDARGQFYWFATCPATAEGRRVVEPACVLDSDGVALP